MKNTDPPDSNTHKPRRSARQPALTPELHRFIQSMGVYFETYGISRIGGQMLGLLMISHEPVSAEQISFTLKVSRASVSTNFPILIAAGLAEKVTLHGDRTSYYAFPATAWEIALQVTIQSVTALRRLAEQGLAALGSGDTARARLQRTIEFCDLQIEYTEKMIAEWRTRKPYQRSSAATSKR